MRSFPPCNSLIWHLEMGASPGCSFQGGHKKVFGLKYHKYRTFRRSTFIFARTAILTVRTTRTYIKHVISRSTSDASLSFGFCATLQAAEQAALREAADTGGVILRVRSLIVGPNHTVATGVIPAAALAFEHPSEFPGHLLPRSVGTMRLSRTGLLDTDQNDELGYLVLQTPVVATGQVPESEDGDSVWVTVAIPDALAALKPGVSGAACCGRCNRPISKQRLIAVPNTRVCTNCQRKKENTCSKPQATSSH